MQLLLVMLPFRCKITQIKGKLYKIKKPSTSEKIHALSKKDFSEEPLSKQCVTKTMFCVMYNKETCEIF